MSRKIVIISNVLELLKFYWIITARMERITSVRAAYRKKKRFWKYNKM